MSGSDAAGGRSARTMGSGWLSAQVPFPSNGMFAIISVTLSVGRNADLLGIARALHRRTHHAAAMERDGWNGRPHLRNQ